MQFFGGSPDPLSRMRVTRLDHFFCISTDLDFGPSVMRTASASWVAPRRIFSRAVAWKRMFLWAMAEPPLGEYEGKG